MVANRLPIEENTIIVDKQKVVLSDCLQYLTGMQDKSINLFVTSPPYNIGIKYGVYKDNKLYKDYLAWLYEIFVQVRRVLRDDGSVFLNVGCTNRAPWLAFDVIIRLKSIFTLQNRFIWVKSISVGDTTFGHFKPINSDRFVNNTYEEIYHLTKSGSVKINRTAIGVPYVDKNNLKRKSDSLDLRCRGNCWYIPYETINSKNQKGRHPAIFPEQLVEMCIRLAGYDDETIVCDPFLGSGTTLVVTKRMGLKGVGIEVDKNYIDYTCKRLTE